jgi:hypothetical protein
VPRAGNRIKQLELDLLPGGVPNTPTRRLSYHIKHALSLRTLHDLYAGNSHKTAFFEAKHVASIVTKAAKLTYHRLGRPPCRSRLAALLRVPPGGLGGGEAGGRSSRSSPYGRGQAPRIAVGFTASSMNA